MSSYSEGYTDAINHLLRWVDAKIDNNCDDWMINEYVSNDQGSAYLNGALRAFRSCRAELVRRVDKAGGDA